jgi:hypothetical protein
VIFLHWGFDMKHQHGLIQRLRRGAQSVRWCLGTVVTVGAAACAPSPEPTHQTVEYYRTNPDARAARLTECGNDPGVLEKTPDCVNAREAERIEGIGSLRDLPPLGLVPDAKKDEPRRSPDASGSPATADEDEPQKRR